mmetsp:Transcript_93854/g.265501  ORF Transcript_93854/g.265501 Transcript_93854/m.265501 type:complete len:231 (-) Transcript_93854:1367-2059(-)
MQKRRREQARDGGILTTVARLMWAKAIRPPGSPACWPLLQRAHAGHSWPLRNASGSGSGCSRRRPLLQHCSRCRPLLQHWCGGFGRGRPLQRRCRCLGLLRLLGSSFGLLYIWCLSDGRLGTRHLDGRKHNCSRCPILPCELDAVLRPSVGKEHETLLQLLGREQVGPGLVARLLVFVLGVIGVARPVAKLVRKAAAPQEDIALERAGKAVVLAAPQLVNRGQSRHQTGL